MSQQSQDKGGGWGRKINLMHFLTWLHLGRQGLPMEIPSDSQEHFYIILAKSVAVCLRRKQNESQNTFKQDDREIGFKRNG